MNEPDKAEAHFRQGHSMHRGVAERGVEVRVGVGVQVRSWEAS